MLLCIKEGTVGTLLFSAQLPLWGLANDMRRLQAANKVEPIGWKYAFVIV